MGDSVKAWERPGFPQDEARSAALDERLQLESDRRVLWNLWDETGEQCNTRRGDLTEVERDALQRMLERTAPMAPGATVAGIRRALEHAEPLSTAIVGKGFDSFAVDLGVGPGDLRECLLPGR